MQLKTCYNDRGIEAGCDEAGRGCLAGPVVAAAVILPRDLQIPLINDSKQLTAGDREEMEPVIREKAIAYAYGIQSAQRIDQINILQASLHAMDYAVKKLSQTPDFLLIDGKHYLKNSHLPYECITGGDGKYASIAAASVLAKTLRDRIMQHLHIRYPQYGWSGNKGYPTPAHKEALREFGISPYHRKTYKTIRELSQTRLFS